MMKNDKLNFDILLRFELRTSTLPKLYAVDTIHCQLYHKNIGNLRFDKCPQKTPRAAARAPPKGYFVADISRAGY